MDVDPETPATYVRLGDDTVAKTVEVVDAYRLVTPAPPRSGTPLSPPAPVGSQGSRDNLTVSWHKVPGNVACTLRRPGDDHAANGAPFAERRSITRAQAFSGQGKYRARCSFGLRGT